MGPKLFRAVAFQSALHLAAIDHTLFAWMLPTTWVLAVQGLVVEGSMMLWLLMYVLFWFYYAYTFSFCHLEVANPCWELGIPMTCGWGLLSQGQAMPEAWRIVMMRGCAVGAFWADCKVAREKRGRNDPCSEWTTQLKLIFPLHWSARVSFRSNCSCAFSRLL